MSEEIIRNLLKYKEIMRVKCAPVTGIAVSGIAAPVTGIKHETCRSHNTWLLFYVRIVLI